VGPLEFSEITKKSSRFPPPACSPASSDRRQSGAAAAAQGRSGHLLLLSFPTRRARALTAAIASCCVLSSPCHAPQRPPTAATLPSPWRARDRAPEPYLLHASALQEPPRPVPLTLSPFPRPQTPEHLHRSTERRRASSSPSIRLSKVTPPELTLPPALPHPHAASGLLLVDQIPPKRRPHRRRSPVTAVLR